MSVTHPLVKLVDALLQYRVSGHGLPLEVIHASQIHVWVELDIPYLQLGILAPGISICGLTAGLEDPLSAQTEGHRSNLS